MSTVAHTNFPNCAGQNHSEGVTGPASEFQLLAELASSSLASCWRVVLASDRQPLASSSLVAGYQQQAGLLSLCNIKVSRHRSRGTTRQGWQPPGGRAGRDSAGWPPPAPLSAAPTRPPRTERLRQSPAFLREGREQFWGIETTPCPQLGGPQATSRPYGKPPGPSIWVLVVLLKHLR